MKKIFIITTLALSLFILNACKRKFELPPKKADQANSGSITIDSIYARYNAYYAAAVTKYYKFNGDVTLTCTVTADEVSGNIYKSIYVKDATGTMQVKMLNAGGFFVGDQIRINLNGVTLDDYGKMVQLDSVDTEKHIVKINTGNIVTPTKATFNQITALNGYGQSNYQGRLVVLDSVEFDIGSKNETYSDAINKTSIDRGLLNSFGSALVVRTSGYANFASRIIPCGKGQITAVVSQYNNTIQLIIRDVNEVKFAAGPCPYLAKNFEDISITSKGWTNYNVTGNINWVIGTIGGNYGNISNYVNSTKYLCETWLISPAIDLTASTNPVLSFKTAVNYTGPVLETYILTNYTGGNPTAAITATLSPALSSGGFAWVQSGNLSLSAYKTSGVRVAFKYSGTASAGSTWEIDNIGIIEN